jgi:hypothetical protein
MVIGRKQRFHPHLSFFERMYIAFFGAPILGLRIRVRNVGHVISKARKRNKLFYAVAFPFLNALGWLGRHATQSNLGAGIVVIGTKPKDAQCSHHVAEIPTPDWI